MHGQSRAPANELLRDYRQALERLRRLLKQEYAAMCWLYVPALSTMSLVTYWSTSLAHQSHALKGMLDNVIFIAMAASMVLSLPLIVGSLVWRGIISWRIKQVLSQHGQDLMLDLPPPILHERLGSWLVVDDTPGRLELVLRPFPLLIWWVVQFLIGWIVLTLVGWVIPLLYPSGSGSVKTVILGIGLVLLCVYIVHATRDQRIRLSVEPDGAIECISRYHLIPIGTRVHLPTASLRGYLRRTDIVLASQAGAHGRIHIHIHIHSLGQDRAGLWHAYRILRLLRMSPPDPDTR